MRTYINGQWGKTATTLDDAKDINDLYRRLATLGFVACEELTCRTGDAEFYCRHMATDKKIFQFDYCCMLHIGDYVSTILLPDLPDVFLLMREIDAQPKKQEAAPVRIANIAELKNTLQQVVTALREIKNVGISVRIAGAENNSQQTDETIFDFEDLSPLPRTE